MVTVQDLGWGKMMKLLAKAGQLQGEAGALTARKYPKSTTPVGLVMAVLEGRYGTAGRACEQIAKDFDAELAKVLDGLICGKIDPEVWFQNFADRAAGRLAAQYESEGHVDTGLLVRAQRGRVVTKGRGR